MAAKKCPMCGHETLVGMSGEYQFETPASIPGGAISVLDATWDHCESCGEDILSNALETAINRERYRRLGLLSPDEIREVRERTGLSAVDMSHLLGVGEKTYTRWENGRSLQTKASDTLIRFIDRNVEMFALVAAEREAGREELVGRYFDDLGQLKGGGQLAMAAHGADMSTAAWDAVRRCLQTIRREKGG